jgi:hypothetical protein
MLCGSSLVQESFDVSYKFHLYLLVHDNDGDWPDALHACPFPLDILVFKDSDFILGQLQVRVPAVVEELLQDCGRSKARNRDHLLHTKVEVFLHRVKPEQMLVVGEVKRPLPRRVA